MLCLYKLYIARLVVSIKSKLTFEKQKVYTSFLAWWWSLTSSSTIVHYDYTANMLSHLWPYFPVLYEKGFVVMSMHVPIRVCPLMGWIFFTFGMSINQQANVTFVWNSMRHKLRLMYDIMILCSDSHLENMQIPLASLFVECNVPILWSCERSI
jgi:hypothetical protein